MDLQICRVRNNNDHHIFDIFPFLLFVENFSSRPWDAHNDISTYENNFIICTRTRHRARPTTDLKGNSLLQSSTLTRGPSPSLNNIRSESVRLTEPIQNESPSIYGQSSDDFKLILTRLESTLNRTNQRLDTYERDLKCLRMNQEKSVDNRVNLLRSFIYFFLIIIVAIIFKYI